MAVSDLRSRTISNRAIVTIAILSVLFVLFSNRMQQFYYTPLVFLVGLFFWRFNILAGGDVKLITVLIPAISSDYYIDIFILTMFLWGLTALGVVLLHRFNHKTDKTVPFGLPMAISGFIGLLASI